MKERITTIFFFAFINQMNFFTLINLRISLLLRKSGGRNGLFDLSILESTRLQQGISVKRNLITLRRCRLRHDDVVGCEAKIPSAPFSDDGEFCSFKIRFNVCNSSSMKIRYEKNLFIKVNFFAKVILKDFFGNLL